MKHAVCHLQSQSPVQQSKFIESSRLEKETAQDHELRCWKERAHVNREGFVFIPRMAFRHSITDAARFLGSAGELQIPGRGKASYVKHFEAGFQILDDLVTPYTLETVKPLWLFVPAQPGRGKGGARVHKCFPVIEQWEGEMTALILDDTITAPLFERVLTEAGRFIGIGAFRLQNRGYFGAFDVTSITWKDGLPSVDALVGKKKRARALDETGLDGT